jgi:mono/diheme cytochrome c family protein
VISTVTNSCAACHSSNLNAGFELGSKITKKTLGNHEKSSATQDCVSSCHHSVKYTSW